MLLVAAPSRAERLEDERAHHIRHALASDDPLLALGSFARAMALFRHDADASEERRFLEQVAGRAATPVTRAHAGWSLARQQALAGDLQGASSRFAALGALSRVRVIGPFANTGGVAWGTSLPLDTGPAIAETQGKRIPGTEREVGWQTVPLNPFGELDLEPRFVATQETRVLLAVVVGVSAPTPAALRLGASGEVRAVLNGVEVVRDDADRPAHLDQIVAGVQLVAGDNLLVIEVGFLGDDARVIARLTRPDGAPLQNLRYAVDPDAFMRAASTRAPRRAPPRVVDPVAHAREVFSPAARGARPDLIAASMAAVAVEERLRTGDLRQRPRVIERWLTELVARQESSAAAPGGQLERTRALAESRARLGAALFDRRDLSGARQAWERAIAEDEACVEAWLGLAALRAEQGDVERARATFRAALAVAPHSDLVTRRALAFERREAGGGLDIDLAIVERADAAPREENLHLAAEVLEQASDLSGALQLVRRGHDVMRQRRLEGRILAARGEDVPLDERVLHAREVVRLRPDNHLAAEALALLLVEAGRHDEAMAIAQARAAEYPERPDPHALTARLALIAGDRTAAASALRRALALVPQDTDLQRTLRAIDAQDDALVARYALDVAGVPAVPASAQAIAVGAQVEASTVAIRFFDNGLGEVLSDKVFRVLDARKAAGLQTFAFDYSPGREVLDVLVAERILADGRREPALRTFEQAPQGKENGAYTDVATRVVMLGQLADGDRIHIRKRKQLVGGQNLFGDFFGHVEPLQSGLPTSNQRIVVEAPLARPVSWGGRGAPAPVVREEADRRVYEFAVPSVAALEPEPGMPPFIEVSDVLSISTYAAWEDLGRWYEALIAPQLLLNAELEALVRSLTENATTEAEKVRRIYEHVVTSTRYVGIELGIHGWKPYPVTEVYRRKFGDCKDKASLLVALLREAGVAANVALVRTANAGLIAPEPPSMWTFNHAVAYVPSLDLFLDGTAEQSGWRELPVMDQGALTLIVGAHGANRTSVLRTIPVEPADANANVSDYVLVMGRDGALAVRGTERFRGAHNAGQRREFADPARWRDRLEQHLNQVMPGARVTRVDVRDLALSVEETGYTFEASLPERAVRGDSGSWVLALSLYPHDLVGSYAQQSSRRTTIFVERPWRTRNVMRYVLPPGVRAVALPTGGDVVSPHLAFRQTVTATADGFIVDEDTALLSRRIPASDYPAFREAALRADALMKQRIRLIAEPSAAPRSGDATKRAPAWGGAP